MGDRPLTCRSQPARNGGSYVPSYGYIGLRSIVTLCTVVVRQFVRVSNAMDQLTTIPQRNEYDCSVVKIFNSVESLQEKHIVSDHTIRQIMRHQQATNFSCHTQTLLVSATSPFSHITSRCTAVCARCQVS